MTGSFNRKLSYYPEFNGGYSSAVGFSGGVRGKVNEAGLIGWGAFLPANLVNPHAAELPHGRNNVVCGLLGIHSTEMKRRFTGWIYAHREINSKDYPQNPETGLEFSYKANIPISGSSLLALSQSMEAIDGYYLAPEDRSYKIASKLSVKQSFEDVDLAVSLESRLGGPGKERLRAGTGLGMEVLRRSKDLDLSTVLIYYNTEDDRYAYIYPYERSFAGWGFMPSSVKGHGLTGAGILVVRFDEKVTVGARLKYWYDFYDGTDRGAAIYLLSKLYF